MRKQTPRPRGRTVLLLGTLGLPFSLAAQPLSSEQPVGAYADLAPAGISEHPDLVAQNAADAPTQAPADDLFAAAIPEDELAAERGGDYQLTQLAQSNETANQSDNAATGNITGGNWISNGAFSGTDGFSTAIQNTGNNVIIQNSLILNVTYAQ